MKIIARKDIDNVKWDQLVSETKNADFYSYTWYLDAVSENWCAIIDDEYTKGIALPFTIRLGVENLYTPVFLTYVEVLGNDVDTDELKSLILEKFSNIFLSTKQNIFGDKCEEYVYQRIVNFETYKIGSQAKRMLKKAEKNNLEAMTSDNFDAILSVVNSELTDKFIGITKQSLKVLKTLVEASDKAGLLVNYEINDLGGIICLEDEQKVFYLKGAVVEDVKKNGGMYLALNSAIDNAREKGKSFDFGGSRVPGVMKFNYNLGGEDVIYYSYKIDNYPIWYRMLRKLKSLF